MAMVSFAGFAFLSGILLGILAIVTAEVIGFLYILKRLNRKRDRQESNSSSDSNFKNFDPRQSIDFSLNKQVVIDFVNLLGFKVFCFLLLSSELSIDFLALVILTKP